jgi:hypothetical protein
MVVARAGQIITAGMLNALADDGTWTPTLTASVGNPNLGAAPTRTGVYHRTGLLVNVWFQIVFGTAPSAGTGTYQLEDLPFDVDVLVSGAGTGGGIRLVDSSSSTAQMVFPRIQSATQVLMQTTAQPTALVTAAVPWTWAAGDSLTGGFSYIADV